MKLQFRIVIPNTKLKLRKVLSGLEFQIASLYQIYIFRPVPQDHSFPKQDKAELAFRLMDKDHDGTITKMEMVKKFKTLTMDQVDKVMPEITKEKFHKNHFPGIF